MGGSSSPKFEPSRLDYNPKQPFLRFKQVPASFEKRLHARGIRYAIEYANNSEKFQVQDQDYVNVMRMIRQEFKRDPTGIWTVN